MQEKVDFKQVMQKIKTEDRLAVTLGIEPVECRSGYGKAVMPLNGNQCNGAGIAHGGAIFSLADIAMALAANSHGYLALTLNSSISYINPGKHGPLTAEAVEVGVSSKVAHYEVNVTDASGVCVARMHAIAYRKNTPFPPGENACGLPQYNA